MTLLLLIFAWQGKIWAIALLLTFITVGTEMLAFLLKMIAEEGKQKEGNDNDKMVLD